MLPFLQRMIRRKAKSGGFRHFRFTVLAFNSTSLRFKEVNFTGDPAGEFPPLMTADDAPAPFVAGGSPVSSDLTKPFRAFDDNASSWFRPSSVVPPLYLSLDCGASNQKAPTAAAVSFVSPYYATEFKIEVSNDSVTWTEVASISGNSSADVVVPLNY